MVQGVFATPGYLASIDIGFRFRYPDAGDGYC